jgi:hypothetical protein
LTDVLLEDFQIDYNKIHAKGTIDSEMIEMTGTISRDFLSWKGSTTEANGERSYMQFKSFNITKQGLISAKGKDELGIFSI